MRRRHERYLIDRTLFRARCARLERQNRIEKCLKNAENTPYDTIHDMSLAEKHCVPCEGRTVPLFRSKAEELLKEVPTWSINPDGKSISKTIKFKDFLEAMHF